jgi:hypothetical protein
MLIDINNTKLICEQGGGIMRNGIDCKGNIWEERMLSKKMKDLAGKKFTKLIALFPIYVQDRLPRKNYWLCKCDCGNYIACRADCLQNQHIQSCGCMTIEGIYKKSEKIINEMIGCRFGKLVVKEFAGYKMKSDGVNKAMFKCKCDCGNDDVIVSGNALRCGLTLSCGCLHRSFGEMNIENILKENKIDFKPEYVFLDLRSDRDGYLRYDFAILDSNNFPVRLIEYDGEQHFKPVDIFGGEENFKIRQENDSLKNQYALSHNIPLVRIPYYKRDSINIDDLSGDKYLVTENLIIAQLNNKI